MAHWELSLIWIMSMLRCFLLLQWYQLLKVTITLYSILIQSYINNFRGIPTVTDLNMTFLTPQNRQLTNTTHSKSMLCHVLIHHCANITNAWQIVIQTNQSDKQHNDIHNNAIPLLKFRLESYNHILWQPRPFFVQTFLTWYASVRSVLCYRTLCQSLG